MSKTNDWIIARKSFTEERTFCVEAMLFWGVKTFRIFDNHSLRKWNKAFCIYVVSSSYNSTCINSFISKRLIKVENVQWIN